MPFIKRNFEFQSSKTLMSRSGNNYIVSGLSFLYSLGELLLNPINAKIIKDYYG